MSHGQVLHVSCFQVHNMAQQSIDCKHVHVQSIQYFFFIPPPHGVPPGRYGRSSRTNVARFWNPFIDRQIQYVQVTLETLTELDDVEDQHVVAALTVLRESMRNFQHLRFQPRLAKLLALVQFIRALHLLQRQWSNYRGLDM